MSFSRRVAQLPGYPMAELPAIKRRLIEQGVDVIDVGAGDADFPPPEVAVKALTRAVQDPAMSRYAFQLGLVAFREAAAGYMRRRFGVSVDPFKELHPLLGSKEGIAHLATAVLNPGDVAIVPVPGYAVYHGGTVLADGEPYLYDLTPRSSRSGATRSCRRSRRTDSRSRRRERRYTSGFRCPRGCGRPRSRSARSRTSAS